MASAFSASLGKIHVISIGYYETLILASHKSAHMDRLRNEATKFFVINTTVHRSIAGGHFKASLGGGFGERRSVRLPQEAGNRALAPLRSQTAS